MVELKHITKIFNRNRPDEFTALEDVSLLVEARKVTVFKGPSGSGKTTLLSIIGAMANLIVIESAGKQKVHIGFWEFFKIGIVVTLLSFVISIGVLLLML